VEGLHPKNFGRGFKGGQGEGAQLRDFKQEVTSLKVFKKNKGPAGCGGKIWGSFKKKESARAKNIV